MTKPHKLTDAQQFLLNRLKDGPVTCINTYAPAKKLVALGLAEFEEGRYGSWTLILKEPQP